MTDTTMSTQTGTSSSDDFLTSIQAAEIKAAEIVATAHQNRSENLQTYRQTLKADQAKNIDSYRASAKKFLAEQARKSAMEREAASLKSVKDADKFYTDKESSVKPLLPDAFAALLGYAKQA
jgi:vacuolar-type H+-ATPase subunit H